MTRIRVWERLRICDGGLLGTIPKSKLASIVSLGAKSEGKEGVIMALGSENYLL
jgi:hypothetical protein